MSDDKSKQGSDRSRISMSEDYEVRYWTQELGVSRDELAEAVKSVGSGADQVRAHLRNRGSKEEA
jgi:hypothetical protein